MVVRSCCLNEQGFAFSASGEVITSLTVAESDGEKKGKRVTGAGKARKEE